MTDWIEKFGPDSRQRALVYYDSLLNQEKTSNLDWERTIEIITEAHFSAKRFATYKNGKIGAFFYPFFGKGLYVDILNLKNYSFLDEWYPFNYCSRYDDEEWVITGINETEIISFREGSSLPVIETFPTFYYFQISRES